MSQDIYMIAFFCSTVATTFAVYHRVYWSATLYAMLSLLELTLFAASHCR